MSSNDHYEVPDAVPLTAYNAFWAAFRKFEKKKAYLIASHRGEYLLDELKTFVKREVDPKRQVCTILWETFNKLLVSIRRNPMTIHDNGMEDGLIELQERLEEVLPFRSDELFDKVGRRR